MAAGVILGFDQSPPSAQLGFAVVQASALFLSATGGTALPQAATPTFSPAAGSYSGAQAVTISDTTTGSSIYLTTDGTTPTYPITGTTRAYSAPISVSVNETIKAIATATGYTTSAVGSASYVISAGGTGVGFNAGPVNYFDTGNRFLNVLNAGFWATQNSSGNETNEEQYLALDSNGYPTSMTGINLGSHTQVFTQISCGMFLGMPSATGVTNPYPAGSYTLTLTGQGSFKFYSSSGDVNANSLALVSGTGVTITGNSAVLTGTGTCVFTIQMTPNGGFQFALTALPSNTNYFTNISLVRTSQVTAYQGGQIFNPDYVALLSGVKVMRFMDWSNVNNLFQFNSSTATVANNATSCTLQNAWTYQSQTRNVYCMNGQVVSMTFAAGSTAVSWTPALTSALSTAFTVSGASGSQGCSNFYIDWLDTWSQRSLPTNFSWVGNQGVPYEVMIDLCNQLGCDCWIPAPLFATPSFLTSFHGLIANGTGITSGYSALTNNFWSEISNEVWNPGTTRQALSEIYGNTLFPNAAPSSGSIFEAAGDWRGYLAAVNASVAQTVWGSKFSRCYPMIACQAANYGTYGDQGEQLAAPYWVAHGSTNGYVGPTTNYPIKACAIAPYFPGGQPNYADSTTILAQSDGGVSYLEQCFTTNVMVGGSNPGTLSSVPSGGWYAQSMSWLAGYVNEFAAHYPTIMVICYEGGQQLGFNGSLSGSQQTAWEALCLNLNRSSFMGTTYTNYLNYWLSVKSAGAVNCLFNDVYGPGQYAWGAWESTYEPTADSPKAVAIGAFL